MKKVQIFFLLLCSFPVIGKADHITGGEMYYKLTGSANGQFQYEISLKLYMRCNSGRSFNDPTIISIFDKGTGQRIRDINVRLASIQNISLPANTNPCVTNPPKPCFDVGTYHLNISLAASLNGYLVSSQVNYRIAGINNLFPNYGLIGATYTCEIPGTFQVSNGPQNNSAHFTGSDLVMICAGNRFSYSFAAADADGDGLIYTFSTAYKSGNAGAVVEPPPPPYQPVPYGVAYFAEQPLGKQVKIDPNTGLITGIAPAAGMYVVTVCVQETRNGVVIASQRKDFQIFISQCSIAEALLEPEYMLCKNTSTITVSNNSTSPLVHSYSWHFLNVAGVQLHQSSEAIVTYTFPDTGTYKIKLYINPGEQCSDSATSIVRVYPGFIPDFNLNGICFNKPTAFSDASSSIYGTVNSWRWDFGEPTATADSSSKQNPVYTYLTKGDKNVQLFVTNSKGCRDTIIKAMSILDKPPIILAFKDTLICLHDVVQLHASGNGIFSWTPSVNMINNATGSPAVSPTTTTTYVVVLNENGCINKDSVKIRVVNHVNLQAMADTTICAGDQTVLHLVSDGLKYAWTPAVQFIDPTVANASCNTFSTTTYHVSATIGGCQAEDEVVVRTVPYPLANAGKDTLICYGTKAELKAQGNGIAYRWSPSSSLSNAETLKPVAHPLQTTSYVLSVFNDLGCPKAGKDTVVVIVQPQIKASGGSDTAIVAGQPLQLKASGGVRYRWVPSSYLSSDNIANPLATLNSASTAFRYSLFAYDNIGCVDSATVLIRIYSTLPSVFVPDAFTPNFDGLNDILKPIAVGIQRIEYFNIYNRWGKLVFSTTANGQGWNGMINGQAQHSESFIWVVKAVDFKGQAYFKRGTVSLIR